MPISPFLNGNRCDPETRRVLGVAFEMVCIALRTEGSDDFVKQAIADKIIELAKAGERNPDVLCEQALKDIRTPLRSFRLHDAEPHEIEVAMRKIEGNTARSCKRPGAHCAKPLGPYPLCTAYLSVLRTWAVGMLMHPAALCICGGREAALWATLRSGSARWRGRAALTSTGIRLRHEQP